MKSLLVGIIINQELTSYSVYIVGFVIRSLCAVLSFFVLTFAILSYAISHECLEPPIDFDDEFPRG